MTDIRTTLRIDARRRRFYQRLSLFRAVNLVAFVALGLTFAAAAAERLIEPQTFHSFGEAAWWAIATVSTTGYGDAVPRTEAGKIVAAIVMVNALALVPAITAVVTTLLVRKNERRLTSEADPQEEILARLDRLERLLGELSERDDDLRNRRVA